MSNQSPSNPVGKPASPYRGNAPRTYWKSAMSGQDMGSIPDLYQKKFELKHSHAIATAGSCFAQHISRHLRAGGYKVLDMEPAPPSLASDEAGKYGYGIYSARFGNIYYVRQLLQLAQEALEGRTPGELVWERDDRFYDALRPTITPDGYGSFSSVYAHRKSHVEAVKKLFESAHVFVFTLGLTEGWELVEDGTVYPTAPGTVAGSFDEAKYRFVNYTYEDIVGDFLKFRELLRKVNPRIRFIISVSPVPLAATASAQHVLVATTYSKAVLRAAAGEIERQCADVDYFPSYEIVSANYSSNEAFDATGRNVRSEVVERVMSYFFKQHPAQAGAGGSASAGTTAPDDESVFCDDALLEVFAE